MKTVYYQSGCQLSVVLFPSLRCDCERLTCLGAALSSLLSSFCVSRPIRTQMMVAGCSLVAKEEDATAMENRLSFLTDVTDIPKFNALTSHGM